MLINSLRNLRASLSRWKRNQTESIFHLLAEYESITARAGDTLPARSRDLRHKQVRFGSCFYIGKGFWLNQGSRFSFGERCSFGEFARIMDHGSIMIGDDFIAATGLQLNSGTHDLVTMEPSCKSITIGNRVWCGANVSILAGVTIGSDVVIGAGSLVRSSIPSGCVVVGVPARVIRTLERPNGLLWTLRNET
jgi:acetyltransferase-like isoleucine patch superfamily enzyme